MEGFCANLVKYLLFITNFIIFILGVAILSLGIWTFVDRPELENLVNTKIYTSSAIVLMVAASFVIMFTFLGCCGAIKESKCMLGTYFTLLLILFVLMIVGAVLGYNDNINDVIEGLENSIKKYGGKSDSDRLITNAWNAVQRNMECCGVDGETGWKHWSENEFFKGDLKVPRSCCMRYHNGTVAECQTEPNKDNAYLKGCVTVIMDLIHGHASIIVGATIAIVIIIFMNLLFSFAMCMMIR